MRVLAFLPLVILAACGEVAQQTARPATLSLPPVKLATGIDRIMGKDAHSVVSLLGPASQDVREDYSRKLQFSGSSCVLDAYLYPPSKGKEPVVTYVAARLLDGRETDKAACFNQLARK